MTATLLDVLNTRLNGINAKVDSLGADTLLKFDQLTGDIATAQGTANAANTTLQGVTAELVVKQQMIDTLTSRVDALIAQLTTLGVQTNGI